MQSEHETDEVRLLCADNASSASRSAEPPPRGAEAAGTSSARRAAAPARVGGGRDAAEPSASPTWRSQQPQGSAPLTASSRPREPRGNAQPAVQRGGAGTAQAQPRAQQQQQRPGRGMDAVAPPRAAARDRDTPKGTGPGAQAAPPAGREARAPGPPPMPPGPAVPPTAVWGSAGASAAPKAPSVSLRDVLQEELSAKAREQHRQPLQAPMPAAAPPAQQQQPPKAGAPASAQAPPSGKQVKGQSKPPPAGAVRGPPAQGQPQPEAQKAAAGGFSWTAVVRRPPAAPATAPTVVAAAPAAPAPRAGTGAQASTSAPASGAHSEPPWGTPEWLAWQARLSAPDAEGKLRCLACAKAFPGRRPLEQHLAAAHGGLNSSDAAAVEAAVARAKAKSTDMTKTKHRPVLLSELLVRAHGSLASGAA